MRLYKRGKVWWYQFQGRRLSTGCTDKPAAEAVFAKAQRHAADPLAAAADSATLGEWAVALLKAKARAPEGTQHMYRYKAGHVVRVLGADARLADLPARVDEYVEHRRAEGAADSAIGKELTALSQLLKLAKRRGAFRGDVSQLRPLGFSGKSVARTAVLAEADEPALRAACSPEQWAAVAFILATGARFSEAMRARAADIDWRRREIRIRGTKTAEADALIPIVERCGMAARLAEAEPFLPLTWAHMSMRLPDVCERAKIPRLTPNDLRRTVATRLIESGVDAYTVAKITRHMGVDMLKRVYDRARTETTRAKIDAEQPKPPTPQPRPRGSGPRRKRVRRST